MDLIEWLLSQGAKVRKGGQEYCINCPKCGDVKKHLNVNPYLGVGHCFRCGYSGLIEEILVDGFGLSFREVRDLVRSYRKVRGNVVVSERKEERVEFPEGSVELRRVGKGVEVLVREWCLRDGVVYEDLVEMGCRWWRGRVVIPCWMDKGRRELWYWVARAVKDVEPKYINSSAPKRGVVWGMDWYEVDDGYLYVCEGWKDAYKVRGIALLGKEVSDEQVRVVLGLVGSDVNVRVLLDRDAWREGVMVGMKFGRVISYERVEVGLLVGLKDPGEGQSKEHVLENALFLGLGDGVGRVVEVMRGLMLKRVGEGLKRLKGECEGFRVHIY
jgi:hypothetical protein